MGYVPHSKVLVDFTSQKGELVSFLCEATLVGRKHVNFELVILSRVWRMVTIRDKYRKILELCL